MLCLWLVALWLVFTGPSQSLDAPLCMHDDYMVCSAMVPLWDQARQSMEEYWLSRPGATGSIAWQQVGLPSSVVLPENLHAYCDARGVFLWMHPAPPGLALALSHYYVRPATPQYALAFLMVGHKRSGQLIRALPYPELSGTAAMSLPEQISEGALVLYVRLQRA